MNNCRLHEKIVLNNNFKRYLEEYAGLIVLYIMAVAVFYGGALILRKKFPIDTAIYPFSTESLLVSIIIYMHQLAAIFQTSTLMSIDFVVITLLWYTEARFEILSLRLKMVKNNEQFKKCIIEHQNVIRYNEFSQSKLGVPYLFKD